jgi:hypothetical protein
MTLPSTPPRAGGENEDPFEISGKNQAFNLSKMQKMITDRAKKYDWPTISAWTPPIDNPFNFS